MIGDGEGPDSIDPPNMSENETRLFLYDDFFAYDGGDFFDKDGVASLSSNIAVEVNDFLRIPGGRGTNFFRWDGGFGGGIGGGEGISREFIIFTFNRMMRCGAVAEDISKLLAMNE